MTIYDIFYQLNYIDIKFLAMNTSEIRIYCHFSCVLDMYLDEGKITHIFTPTENFNFTLKLFGKI